jgi:hypothetical protein
MSVLQKLTEGVVTRDVRKEGEALLNKWEQTGLLEGLNDGQQKQGMAVLLENQAKELLREASSMAAGDVEGFAAVAFPIVRRVFGGLIANDLVSVQPMSLPSGLIFFLDFTHEATGRGAEAGESVFGGNKVGKGITEGVDLSPARSFGHAGGHYDLGNAYAHAHTTGTIALGNAAAMSTAVAAVTASALTDAQKKLIRYDADILAQDTGVVVTVLAARVDNVAAGTGPLGAHSAKEALELINLSAVSASVANTIAAHAVQARRLTELVDGAGVSGGSAGETWLKLVFLSDEILAGADRAASGDAVTISMPIPDAFGAGPAIGSVIGSDAWGLEEPSGATGNQGSSVNKNEIAEIDIKVDSIAVTAQTKKLKAKWSPELGQDLNAYHNLDAEVELTGILSEQIALEIDRELLGDLVNGATAGTRYWSRAPGLFVDSNGSEIGASALAPDFTGTVSEWYETLIETINDVSAQIHRKTLRGGANFVVCSPEVANILEFTSGFRASVTADQDRGTIGAVRAGSLSKKFDVYVDPYFLRNVILVGRKGSSFLESGFVYAPYVPLQVTPTIFGTEDFVPRKGVMTRYAKKMVRPDMYGLVVVRGLLGESGA